MGIEIERRFLVKRDVWEKFKTNNNIKGEEYKQGYICNTPEKTVRIRVIKNEISFLTIKGPSDGIGQKEFEYQIPINDGQDLFKNFTDSSISKIRHIIPIKNHKKWEVDEFLDDNNGLMIAEIELDNPDEDFEMFDWVGQEITGDFKYSNASLSINPYKLWKSDKGLQKFEKFSNRTK